MAGLDQLQPDLVVNTGDNLSDLKAVPATLRALGPLMRRPGLFVFGSNDYYAPTVVNPLSYVVGKKRKASRVELPWRGMRAAFIEHGWQDATHRRLEFKVGSVRIAATGVDDPHHDLDDYGRVSGGAECRGGSAVGVGAFPRATGACSVCRRWLPVGVMWAYPWGADLFAWREDIGDELWHRPGPRVGTARVRWHDVACQ